MLGLYHGESPQAQAVPARQPYCICNTLITKKIAFAMKPQLLAPLVALLALASSAMAKPSPGAPPLTPQKPIVIPGGPGGFDWMSVDVPLHRVFATHKGTHSIAVVDTRTGQAAPSVPAGTAQGLAVDTVDGTLFAGDEDEKTLVVLDRRTLKMLSQVPVTGPVDAVAFDPKTDTLYAGHDDGTEVWVIDGRSRTLIGAIPLSGAPEFLQYSPVTDRVYQNVKTTNTIAVIDPRTNKVQTIWKTAPVTSPHGLAIDDGTGRLFTAGDGKLAVLDLRTGRVLAVVPIAGSVDQITFDPGLKRVYCACGQTGMISVVQETAAGRIQSLGNVRSAKGAHTITVDPQSHTVWVCYSDARGSYLQAFRPE